MDGDAQAVATDRRRVQGAGRSSVKVTVVPKDDTIVDGNETVILMLLGGMDYDIGAPASATVTIVDNDPLRPR